MRAPRRGLRGQGRPASSRLNPRSRRATSRSLSNQNAPSRKKPTTTRSSRFSVPSGNTTSTPKKKPINRFNTSSKNALNNFNKKVTSGRASAVTGKRDPELEKKLKKALEDRRKKLTKAPPRPTPSDKGKTGFRRTPPVRRR